MMQGNQAKARAGLLLAIAAGWVLASPARAQDGPIQRVPRVTVVGFQDLDDGHDCGEVVSRYGRCVEEVQFRDLDQVFSVHPREQDPDRLTAYGELYSWIWDDLARRWKGDELITSTLGEAGLKYLPESGDLWGHTPREPDARTYSMPARDLWLEESEWVGLRSEEPIYRHLEYRYPNGLVPPPDVALIKGRFAQGLAADGRRHQYDIMDGDPESSAPFFEQMYPYDQALASREAPEAEDEYVDVEFGDYGAYDEYSDRGEPEDEGAGDDIPLAHFVANEALKGDPTADASTAEERRRALIEARRASYPKTQLEGGGIEALTEMAEDEFENFYENVGVQIVRFAREEYTPTHLRVLTALMAMHDPPGTAASSRGLVKDPVAASEGQLDSEDMIMGDVAAAAYALDSQFDLNYQELPTPVVEQRLELFEQWKNPSQEFRIEFTYRVAEELELLLRRRVSPFTALDDRSLIEWAEANARTGRAPMVRQFLKPLGLALIVSQLEGTKKDRIETSLLLDHVRFEFVSRFDSDPTVRQTPGELEAMASEQWATVLRRHGFFANAIPDGPGTVDPLAICTTRKRAAALEEPVFGSINVDGLVVASDALTDPKQVLWEGRSQLPFLLVDDPAKNEPDVTRLVSLPDHRAIYRVRWKVWTGWHLLWAPDPVSVEDGTYRVALRTAALCDDMVLAPPDLVATLVRAATLEGDFRPVNVVDGTGDEALDAYYSEPSNDELYADGRDYLGGSLDSAGAASEAAGNLDNPPDAVEDAASAVEALPFGKKEQKAPLDPVRSEAVAYVRDLVADPLREVVDGKAGILVVFDESAPREKRRIRYPRPRSPYLWQRSKLAQDEYVYAATWAWYLPPAEGDDPTRKLIAPAFLPTESVNTDSLVQHWTRRRTADWTLAVGLGMFPRRKVSMTCKEGVTDPGVVKSCQGGEQIDALTEGFAADISGLRTIWTSGAQRWAVEFGPELRIDLLHPGQSWFYGDEAFDFGWVHRTRGGVIGGIRFAPHAAPLSVNAKRFPWGAERPDGTARLNRVEYGARVGAMFGPGFNGFEAALSGEIWAGWSLRRKRAPSASFTPYHPAAMLGPYARFDRTWILAADETRYYSLQSTSTLYLGVRGQLRLNGSAAGSLPEGQ